MKKLYKLSLLLVAIMILTMSAASAADTNDMADVISEEESNSLELDESLSEAEASGNDDVLADDGTTFSSLQDEIDGGGNSVTLTKNYTRIDSDNDINITKDITIDGKNEYKIDADKKGRIFDIKNAEVTLIGITFENGKINPDYGGIICANNSKLTIINCTFYNFFNYNRNSNYVGWGGAISAINCDSLTVDNCKFIFSSYDTTAAYGGAIYSNNTKNNIIKNSRFTGMAAAEDGGAIYIINSDGTNTIYNCEIYDNQAGNNNGGGLYAQNLNITVDKCYFHDNSMRGEKGAAIFFEDGIINLTNSKFENNDLNGALQSISISGDSLLIVKNNTQQMYDITVLEENAFTQIKNVTILENKTIRPTSNSVTLTAVVLDVDGNKIFDTRFKYTVDGEKLDYTYNPYIKNYNYKYTIPAEKKLYTISMDYNTTAYPSSFPPLEDFDIFTGAIDKTPVKGTYTDLQSQIDATPEGGVLNLPYNFTYNLGVDADKFPNGVILNKAITINGNGFTISGNNSKRIFILEKEVKINLNDITFANGNATEGGAVYLGWEYDDVNITNCIFENNTAVEGGAIFNGYHYINVDSCTFKNNTATENGGAIFIQGDGENKTIKNSKFEDNNATKGKSIYIDCADVYFENNIVNTKEAEIAINARIMTEVTATVLEGQKIKVKGGDKVQLNATLTDDNGNLIYLINQDMLKFTVSDADSTEIVVQEQDYTKYSANYTVPFETGNYTVSMKEDTSSEWVNLPNLTVINATLENDVPPVPGTYTDLQAKINKLKDGEVLNLTYDFAYNQEIDGDRFPEGVVINKNIIINGNGFTISGNNSKRVFKIGDGSAEINVNLNNITFANGNSSDNGGAIYSAPKTSIAIDNCNFTNNLAETGGAIYSASANTNITNSKFENNIAKAGSQSNAALFDESKVYLDKNTINKDQAEIYLSKSALLSKSNVTVMGNETITAASPNVNLTAVIYDDSGNLIYDDSVDFTVTQIDGNYKKEIKAEAGSANYNATDVLPGLGTYLISMKSNVDSDLIFDNIKTAIIEYKAETKINVTVDGDSTYPNATVTITTNADGNYTVKIGNTTKVVELKANTPTVVNVNGATPGDNQVVNVTFNGTGAYYSAVNDTETINIKKATPKLNVTVNKENYPNDVRLNVTSDVDGKVEVKVGNVTKIVDVKAGVTQEVIIDNATVGENQVVNVTYIENENCTSAVNDTNIVNVNKYTPKINVTVSSDEYPASINVTADVTGEYTIKVGNISKKVTLEKGKPQRITLEGLAPSDSPYQVNVTSDANPDYNAAFNDTVEIKVAKGTPELKVATEEVNHYPNVVVNITSDANGTVNVTIYLDDGKSVTKQVNVTAGETVSVPFEGISPSKTEDGYQVEATYLENDMYNSVTEGAPLHVYPGNATLNVTADAVQGENSTITINVPENATGNVTVTIDGKNYTGTIKNGTATITGPVLPSGDTPANVTYTSDNGNYQSKTVPATIHVKTVEADVKDMKRGWNSPYDYQTTLTDEDGKGIAGKNIVFTINGKQYNATTDSNGVAKLTGSKLDVGEYNVTVTNPLTGENKTAKITIVARLLENKDLTKDYMSSKQFTVLAIGDDGNPVGAGEVVTLVTHGVTYKQKTDNTGHATLLIRLVPGNYPITATYKGYTVKNNIKVKQTLKLVKKTVSVKKGKKIILKATLKWTSGKAIKDKIIKFKFKGKTYKAKTNSKGLAKVTIKSKKVLKKLKKGKKYSYSATYVKNKVKGKVKIK